MREIVLMSFVMLSICTSSFAQEKELTTEYLVQYHVNFSYYKDKMKDKREETLYLYTGANYSVFMNHNEANKEEIEQSFREQAKLGKIDMKATGRRFTLFDTSIYKLFNEDLILGESKMESVNYVYKEPEVLLDWKITEEQKEFNRYAVQKATTSFAGRDYEAWFTMEIPISDGPHIFHGLPGLIVELYDTEQHYHFELEGLKKLETPRIFKLDTSKVLDKSEYKEIKEKIHKNKATLLYQRTAHLERIDPTGKKLSEAEVRRRLKKGAEREINALELE